MVLRKTKKEKIMVLDEVLIKFNGIKEKSSYLKECL